MDWKCVNKTRDGNCNEEKKTWTCNRSEDETTMGNLENILKSSMPLKLYHLP